MIVYQIVLWDTKSDGCRVKQVYDNVYESYATAVERAMSFISINVAVSLVLLSVIPAEEKKEPVTPPSPEPEIPF